MSEIVKTIFGFDTFSDVEILIKYIESKRRKSRALVLYTHLVQLAYLSGLNLLNLSKDELFIEWNIVSLNDYKKNHIDKLIFNTRKRLENNLISDNWVDLFLISIEETKNKEKTLGRKSKTFYHKQHCL